MCVRRVLFFFFFKQKTAYEMRISDWSSDVCSSDLILSRYDDAPRALDRAAKDARELSQLVGETMNGLAKATKENPLGAGIYTQEMADADARRIQYGVQKQIGRAHVRTPVTNAHHVSRLLPEYKKHPDQPLNNRAQQSPQKTLPQ